MLLHALLDLAVPLDCGGCGAPGARLCAACGAALRRLAREPPPARRLALAPGREPMTVLAATAYADPVRALVVRHKDGGRSDVLPVLATLLRTALARALTVSSPASSVGDHRLLVVPVPSSRAAARRRGRLAWEEVVDAALAGQRQLPVVRALTHRRAVHDQAGLGARARSGNLRGALACRPGARVHGAACVVVDDVVTTGATLREAARALEAGGAHVVGGAVVAAVPTVGRGLDRADRGPWCTAALP